MEKVDTMQEQISNIGREMETAKENRKEMLEIKSTVTEMKTAFDGLISRRNMTEKRIGDPEEVSMATSKIEKQREKNNAKHGAECTRTVGQLQTVRHTHNGNARKKKEKKKQKKNYLK